jgi:hypothetical protein
MTTELTTELTTETRTPSAISAPSRRTARRGRALCAALAVAGTGLMATAAPAGAHDITGPISGETRSALAQVRAATAGYHDVSAAEADGFVQASPCVSNPNGPGAMGVHYVDMARLATGFELTRPEVLIYEPQQNGRMRLVGVEYVLLDADQDASTVEQHTFPGGVGFHAPHAGSAPVAYTLHAYVWKNNPAGLFVDYNPRNSCP